MALEDTIGYGDPCESCIVCGKNVTSGGGFARVNHKGTMVNLCCPHCLETFEENPAPHMARLAKVLQYRALRDVTKASES